MNIMSTKPSTLALANVYARHFVEDFASNVMQHLGGSYPLSSEARSTLAKAAATNVIGDANQLAITNTNAIGRFLYECADHALTAGIENPEGLESWNTVSSLPSVHHDEINNLVFNSADFYQKTINQTILGVVAKDAHIAAQLIAQKAQSRQALIETGGTLHEFNWGILNDGLWLNGALLRAFDYASIFRSGDPVVAYYATTAFDFARQHATSVMLTDEVESQVRGEIDMLLSQLDKEETSALLDNYSQNDLNSLLFTRGSLTLLVDYCYDGIINPTVLVKSVEKLSHVAYLLSSLVEATKVAEEDMLSSVTVSRIHQVYKVVTLILAGYEALRETRYAEAVILSVISDGTDPKVDVIVNGDMMNAYHAAGGDDANLIRFGQYLDPRKGIPAPSGGWNLSFILARTNDVVPKMMAEDADRLERLRSNDAAVIQDTTMKVIGGVVQSYLLAKGSDTLRSDISQRISGLARQVTNDATSIDLSAEITGILISVIDDPFLTSVTTRFMDHLSADAASAASVTIAETAAVDAVNYIAMEESEG